MTSAPSLSAILADDAQAARDRQTLADTRASLGKPDATPAELVALVAGHLRGVSQRHDLTIDPYKREQHRLALSRLSDLRDRLQDIAERQ